MSRSLFYLSHFFEDSPTEFSFVSIYIVTFVGAFFGVTSFFHFICLRVDRDGFELHGFGFSLIISSGDSVLSFASVSKLSICEIEVLCCCTVRVTEHLRFGIYWRFVLLIRFLSSHSVDPAHLYCTVRGAGHESFYSAIVSDVWCPNQIGWMGGHIWSWYECVVSLLCVGMSVWYLVYNNDHGGSICLMYGVLIR
jgi:hypothetical protein